MQFVPVRDLRIRPGAVWRTVKKDRRVLVTSNGKPLALLTDMEGRDLEQELRAQSIAEGMVALSQMRRIARERGMDRMSMEDIDREISRTRRSAK
jgi:prevent-host-death family protein